ncbi:hypothetical protein VNO77_01838 [Canavalia gladiata]|uniref:Uncharacterized protein n=1 Tax=Canavalia gladiata TaxID=3824 RepID=A0AAN9MYC8_CANGL
MKWSCCVGELDLFPPEVTGVGHLHLWLKGGFYEPIKEEHEIRGPKSHIISPFVRGVLYSYDKKPWPEKESHVNLLTRNLELGEVYGAEP